jgi:hypothetical protein
MGGWGMTIIGGKTEDDGFEAVATAGVVTVAGAMAGGAGNFATAGAGVVAMISPGVGGGIVCGKARAGALMTGAGEGFSGAGAAALVGLSTAGTWATTGAATPVGLGAAGCRSK